MQKYSQKSQKKKGSQPSKKDTEKSREKQVKKVHRGVFIADERRKGRGGRIKSQSIPNKIEVRMKKDAGYLHETQVQWVEVARYNKKEGRNKKKQEKRKTQYKLKGEQNQKKQNKRFKQKAQTTKNQKEQAAESEHIDKKQSQKSEQTEVEHQQAKIQTKKEKQNEQNVQQKKQQGQRDRESESQQSSESDNDKKNDDVDAEQHEQKKQEEERRQQDDIVIVGEIKKQISNPFWSKPFVGVIQFIQKPSKPNKQKYLEKSKKSQVSIILDDNSLDFHPIHLRLPVCYIIKDNNTEKMFEQYVDNNFKIDYSQKGGKVRNKIMDELQNTYALAKYAETNHGNVYVEIIKIIGKARTIDGECGCFLYEHQLNDFQHEKKQENQAKDIEINASQVHKQYQEMVFTIDPLTSTDLDDALSVRKLSDTTYEIGIHISDVSSYMPYISREQLAKRTTSVYLPHYVFHMLPTNLVTVCSENPNVKRLAFTIFVKMNNEGQILGSTIQKNVIKSRFKLAYEHAEGLIKGELDFDKFKQIHQCSKEEYDTLLQKVKILEMVGLAHRKKRLVCEIFDNDEIKFQLDQDKWPISFTVTSRISSQKIVEQFMIIGNIEAAKKQVSIDPKNSLIIHHPKPSELAIRQFNEYFKILNYKIKFQNSRQLQEDLLKVEKMENISPQIKKLCFFKARRAQETAAYKRFSEVQNISQKVHFALDLRYYTHFTSPMRRLADILVHQTLNQLVDPKCGHKELTDLQIEQANFGRKNTKRLKKDLTQVYLCLMIHKTQNLVPAQAIVVSYGCKSISIYIPMLDMSKEIMWYDMEVDKVFKNKNDTNLIDVVIYYDRKSSANDVVWIVDKFSKIQVRIGCAGGIPLRLDFQFLVKTNKGDRKIRPKIKDY